MRVLIAIALVSFALVMVARADDAPPPVEPTANDSPSPSPPIDAGAVPDVAAAPVPAEPAPPPLPPVSAITDRGTSRNFAGSVQLDYLALPHAHVMPDTVFAGATVELSLKLAMDLGDRVTANVKVCFACHGFEVGMAYFDLRAADELSLRVGRFSPSMGSFPLRHDPANHATSDKPLMYDMGRMVRFRDWNEGVLPAPWVDNGIEVHGSHFFGPAQVDYAVYAIIGPKGDADGIDFDFTQSRSGERYYVDNNGEPAVGGRLALTLDLAPRRVLTLGASGMAGHYDPEGEQRFGIAGADVSLQLGSTFVRAEGLARWTHFARGDDPAARFKYGPDATGRYPTFAYKDGFDLEVEQRVGRTTLIARWDGLRRAGNVLATSELSDRSSVLRYTAAVAVRLIAAIQLKISAERYVFSDFADETAMHLGFAGPL